MALTARLVVFAVPLWLSCQPGSGAGAHNPGTSV